MTQKEYPSGYETDVVLKDGSRILLRPITKDDTERWLDFMSRLSTHTKYLRFHHVPKNPTQQDAARQCSVDYHNSFAMVAEVIRDHKKDIVAIGRYQRLPQEDSAEVGFLVEETYQDRGIGTKLLEQLVATARENGISTFEADVLAENKEMIKVFTDYGFHVKRYLNSGEYRVTFPISDTPEVAEKKRKKEQQTTIASLSSLLSPRSVALIGASRDEDSIGQLLLLCMMEAEFSGTLYPINPKADTVLGLEAYSSVLDVKAEIDLALIAVPAAVVPEVVDECGRKGVRSLIIISEGFKEVGDEGPEREQRVRQIALGYGMRVMGPNCMGVINTDPRVKLNATFSRNFPSAGNVAFLSQSGALGLAMLAYADRLKMGLSTFVSIGNRADISSNDLLAYWEEDERTGVILLYLESFGNPKKFGRIARRLSARKPIIAIKGGRTPAGSQAAATHTGAMASSASAIDALFLETGIVRVDTLEEAFGVINLLSKQPLPSGNRVAILTNGGGPGIMAADACESHGLVLSEFSHKVTDQLRSASRREISINNPLDLTASAGEEEFEKCLCILARDPGNDAVILIFIPPVKVDTRRINKAVEQALSSFKKSDKPLIACLVGQPQAIAEQGSGDVPAFVFPEEAVSALEHAVQYGKWLKKPKGRIARFPDIEYERARKLVEEAMQENSERPFWLSIAKARELLACYGIHMADTAFAGTADEAAKIAAQIDFPVAVKLASPTIAHKTDVGGIILGMETEEEVKQAFADIRARLSRENRAEEMEGVVLQPMITGGVETIVGVTEDPTFGPLIMFGLGGVYTELLHDVAVRLHPLTDVQAGELINSVRLSALLKGWRGNPPSDIEALKQMLLRLSSLVEEIEEITEVDLNPVMVLPEGEGYRVLDPKIRIK